MSDVQDYRYGDELVPESAGREVPVNPYSLLEAVNDASEVAHTSWLIFLGVIAYLTVAVAGVSHQDLLLNTALVLPVLQVEIELTQFFTFAPFVLLFMHFGMLVQHIMLARKVLEFDMALRPLEATDTRSHPLRLELHSYFFTQAMAGPERSRLLSMFLHAMIWTTVVILPIFMIIYIQAVFLPYHDVAITWSHRIALVCDALLLLGMGLFLERTETRYWGAFTATAKYHPFQFTFMGTIFIVLLLFSFFVATIPDEWLDRFTRKLPGLTVERVANADNAGPSRDVFWLTAWLFEGQWDPSVGRYRSVFQRNLVVTDLDLVSDKDEVQGEVTRSLRDRDLRLAKLDRSDLHGADFIGANLEQATLVGADLRGAKFSCADADAARVTDRAERTGCARLEQAILTRANLANADLSFAVLSEAKFEEATLTGADLRYITAVATDFTNADLNGANLSVDVDLTASNFLNAKLQGADLRGARLHLADLSSAKMHGAQMRFVQAIASNFKGAELDGANVLSAKFYGADLGGISARGADFSQTTLWDSRLPGKDAYLDLADLSQLKLKPPSEKDIQSLEQVIAAIRSPVLRDKLKKATLGFVNLVESQNWERSDERAKWQDLLKSGPAIDQNGYRFNLTQFLGDLSCRVRFEDGGVATGVVLRATSPGFKADPTALYARLKSQNCPASGKIAAPLMQRLATSIESREPAPAPVAAAAAEVVTPPAVSASDTVTPGSTVKAGSGGVAR